MHAGTGRRQANVQSVMTDWGADTRIEYGPNSTNSSSSNRADNPKKRSVWKSTLPKPIGPRNLR